MNNIKEIIMNNSKEWDVLLNTLVTYGQELLQYQDAYYSYQDEQLILSWKTGEDSGGNCWGGKATYHASNQKQPDFTILDELLFQIDPDIKLRDFRSITANIQFEETSHREYYGNGTYFNQLVLDKEDLIKTLKNCGYDINLTQLKNINNHFEEKAYAHIERNTSHTKRGW